MTRPVLAGIHGIVMVVFLSFQASGQSVKLTWAQSRTDGISANNVYRSNISGGPYSEIYETSAPVTKFTDLNVVDGETYCYVVTAVAAGIESIYSNEACEMVTTQAPSDLHAK